MKAIMYHYVRPFDDELPNLKHLHFEDFKKQLDYFEEEYGFVSKSAFIESFHNKKKIPTGIILTFDDALKCHYQFVFHELKKRNLWGIFYIPTRPYSQDKLLDVHRTHLLLGKYPSTIIYNYLESLVKEELLDKEKIEEFKKFTYSRQTNDDYTLKTKRLLNYFISYNYRENILDQLMAEFFPDEKEVLKDFYITTRQIKEMNESGMIIGSHTINHPVMSRLSYEEQHEEIYGSFKTLSTFTGNNLIKTFCYPYGGFHSFNGTTEKILNQSNCLFSFNVEQRDISLSDVINRRQALPRYDCNQFKYGQVRGL